MKHNWEKHVEEVGRLPYNHILSEEAIERSQHRGRQYRSEVAHSMIRSVVRGTRRALKAATRRIVLVFASSDEGLDMRRRGDDLG